MLLFLKIFFEYGRDIKYSFLKQKHLLTDLCVCVCGGTCSVVTKVLVCDHVVSEFELYLRYYVYFRTNAPWERYEAPYPPSYGLNSIIAYLLQG